MSNVLKDYNVKIDDGYILIEEIKKYKTPISNNQYTVDDQIKTDHEKIKQHEIMSENVLIEAKKQAIKIVNDAKAFSKRINEDALLKAKQEYEKAQKEGFEEGKRQAQEISNQKLKTTLEEVKEFINLIEQEKQNLYLKYENDLKDLSLSIAKKIVDTELNKNDEAFLDLFKGGIKHLNKQDTLKLSISELDAEFVTTNKETLLQLSKGIKNIEIDVIEEAPKGTCIIETDQCLVNSSSESQFNKIKQTLEKQPEI